MPLLVGAELMDASHPRSLREWLTQVTQVLRAAGVPSPEVDARALVQHALGLSPTTLLTRAHELVSAEQAERLKAVVRQRAARVPLQHLLGAVEWGGVTLRVDQRALIPRPETEWLLHLALQAIRFMRPNPANPAARAPRVADVGTGTGALALGFKHARPDALVTATDISPAALSLARENAALNGLQVTFLEADLLTGVTGPFDLILSNPPYLPESDQRHAPPEVQFDPPLALYAGPDGLSIARRLTRQAYGRLEVGGLLFLELDPRNASILADELRAEGWEAKRHADLSGRERFIEATPQVS